MNAARRARKRASHIGSGAHSSNDHTLLQMHAALRAQEDGKITPYAIRCPACMTGPKKWDRSLAGKSV